MHSGKLCDFGFDQGTHATLKAEEAGPTISCTYWKGHKNAVPFYRKTICQSAALSFQDQVEHETYEMILPYVNSIDKADFIQSESTFHDWLQQCRRASCLAGLYARRMSYFLAESTNMPIDVHNKVLWQIGK